MSMAGLFDRIRAGWRKRQASTAAGYAALIRDIADGKEPKNDIVEGLLVAAGKDAEQLVADVQRLVSRRELAQHAKAGDTVPAERDQLLASEKQAEAEYNQVVQAAKAKFDHVYLPIRQRHAELDAIQRRADDAKRKLIETADPSIEAELAANREQQAQLLAPYQGVGDARDRRDPRRLEQQAEVMEQFADRAASLGMSQNQAEYKGRADQLRGRAESERENFAAVQEQLGELRKQEAALMAKQLEP